MAHWGMEDVQACFGDTATINTEICEQLGIDFDELSEKFAPYCTKVQSIVTAESFDDVQ